MSGLTGNLVSNHRIQPLCERHQVQRQPIRIMTLSPIVTSTRLAKYEVARSKELTKSSTSNAVHCPWFQIDQNSTRYIFTSAGFTIVNRDSL
uniref:Uncharacterized protein n=1 Tax=Tetranychus urticae TaxID=32264 RepID=T1KQ96_TETUR